MPRFDSADVRRYYDRHTPAFVRLGQGGGAIHRAVWAPDVTNREQAFHYVEDQIARRIADELHARPAPRVVDLGCGVGASLCHLAGRLPIRGVGVTLSPLQATQAAERLASLGLADRIECVEGDYLALPEEREDADLVYAIESFVHGASPRGFFHHCARLLRPGGRLVICDDFARRTNDPAAGRAVGAFTAGWHVNTLIGNADLRALAEAAGLQHESTDDLTPFLELGRPRDRALALLAPVLGRLPFIRHRVDHLLGGCALQTCLARGWVGYDLVVFRRKVATTG
jgi:cyclopropane fatty-acyl-phospholipid synthase-like methyltransferase